MLEFRRPERNMRVCLGAAALGGALLAAASAFALTADEQMRFADGIYLRGFYDTAVSEYLLLIRDHPDYSGLDVALYRTGESYRQLGNQMGADRFYQRLVREFPASPFAARAELRRVEMAVASERYADAKGILDSLPARADMEADTRAAMNYYGGLCLQHEQDAAGAEAAWQRVLDMNVPTPFVSFAALALAELHAADSTRAGDVSAWYAKAVESAPTPVSRAEALYQWGNWAYRAARYNEAMDALQMLMTELPMERRAKDARLTYASSLFRQGEYADVLEMAEAIVADAPNADAAATGLFLRASSLRHLNRLADAIRAFTELLNAYPASPLVPQAVYERTMAHFARNEMEDVRRAPLVASDSAFAPDMAWMRAEAALSLGQTGTAQREYENLLEQFPKAPQAASAWVRLAQLERDVGNAEQAAAYFKNAARKELKAPPAVAENALRSAAYCYSQIERYDDALASWDDVLKRRPSSALAGEALLQKALTLQNLNRGKEAHDTLEKLLKSDPAGAFRAQADYWLGFLYSQSGDSKKAEQFWRDSLAHQPDESTEFWARLRLALLMQQQQRESEAADMMESLIERPELVSGHAALVEWLAHFRFDQGEYERVRDIATVLAEKAAEPSWRQIGWYWRGAALTALGDSPAAIQAYEKSVAESASTKQGAEAMLLLADLERKAGKLDSAETRFRTAAEMATFDEALEIRARAYFGLAEVAAAAGKHEAAARHYMSVAILFDDPELSPRSLYAAGASYGLAGKHTEQQNAWAELRTRYPDSGFARQVHSELEPHTEAENKQP